MATLPDLALRAARHPAVRTTELPGARRHIFALQYGDPPDSHATIRLIDARSTAAGALATASVSGTACGDGAAVRAPEVVGPTAT